MKILVIHEIEWIDKVIFEPHHLSEILSMQGNDVFVIDCAAPNPKRIVEGLNTRIMPKFCRVYEKCHVTLIRPPSLLITGLNRLTYFFSCKDVIKKIILEEKIQVVLLYGAITNGIQTIQICRENNIPVIYRLLDISHGLISLPIVKQVGKRLESKVIKNSDLVLTTTKDLRRYAIKMGGEERKIEIFPLGVNLQEFKPMEKSMELKKKICIENEDRVIIFVGTVYKFAGLEMLINNFQMFKNKVKFIIVGGGPDLDRINSLIKTKGLENKIITTGFVDQRDVARYIAFADICINPFDINYVTDRILPTKILEYLACKKPVLSTPLKGTKELLLDGKYGVTYSKQNNFVFNLDHMLNNKEELNNLGEKGYSYVTKNHDWSHLTEKLFHIFEKIISTK